MAAAYVKIYVNKQDDDHLVRTFGGNERDVRHMAYLYASSNGILFLKKHPYFTEMCKKGWLSSYTSICKEPSLQANHY